METTTLTEHVPSTSTNSAPSTSHEVSAPSELQQEFINIRKSIQKIQHVLRCTTLTQSNKMTVEIPMTLNEFSKGQFDGMTRITLLQYVENFVNVIEHKSKHQQTIGELLLKRPLIRNVGKGAMISIVKFRSGMEIKKIALESGSNSSIIVNHLCIGLKKNWVDLGRLLPADKLANIIQVLQSPSIDYDMRSLLPIKKLCHNPHATFHDLTVCRAYLMIRHHLMTMNLSYEDDYSLVTVNNKSEYKSTFETPKHNTLTFLRKCVFPLTSKDKKINNLPTELFINGESSELNLLAQSDIKPRNIKSDMIPVDVEQNGHTSILSGKIIKFGGSSSSPSQEKTLKPILVDLPLQDVEKQRLFNMLQSKCVVGDQGYPKSKDQTILFNDERDEDIVFKTEKVVTLTIDDDDVTHDIKKKINSFTPSASIEVNTVQDEIIPTVKDKIIHTAQDKIIPTAQDKIIPTAQDKIKPPVQGEINSRKRKLPTISITINIDNE